MASITFIGMGSMGRPMSKSLLRAGHDVTGFDVSTASMELAKQQGIHCVAELAEALKNAEVVISMIPTGKHVVDVYTKKGGVLDCASPNALLIDSSTIDVASSRRMHAITKERGFTFIDAPVTGAVPFAEKGALTFMVGADANDFERAVPILNGMGNSLHHVGAAGAGHAMKICNNMMTGMSMLAISEVFALGEKFGLTYQSIFDVVSKGSGSCWALINYCPVPGPVPTSPANFGYGSKFSMPMMLKDLRLSQSAADELGAATPLAASATAVYQMAVSNGLSEKDFSAIFEFVSGRYGSINK